LHTTFAPHFLVHTVWLNKLLTDLDASKLAQKGSEAYTNLSKAIKDRLAVLKEKVAFTSKTDTPVPFREEQLTHTVSGNLEYLYVKLDTGELFTLKRENGGEWFVAKRGNGKTTNAEVLGRVPGRLKSVIVSTPELTEIELSILENDAQIIASRNKLINANKTSVLPQLTEIERVVLFDYTGSSFERINKGLRNGSQDPFILAYEKVLNNALDKLPNYNKNSVRFSGYYSDVEIAIQKGEFIDNGFLSSTAELDSKLGFNNEVVFTIEGETGKLIEDISQFPHEREVLFKSKTKFIITSCNKQDGVIYLFLKEIK
jgi:NAD:arginine ADP-ribosyltransferase